MRAAPPQSTLPVLLAADKGKGLTIRGQMVQQEGQTGDHCLETQSGWHTYSTGMQCCLPWFLQPQDL